MTQEPHYRCAVSGDLTPESELAEVPVYTLKGSHFMPDKKTDVLVKEELLPSRSNVAHMKVLKLGGEAIAAVVPDGLFGEYIRIDQLAGEHREIVDSIVEESEE